MKKFLHCSGISVAEVKVQVKKVGFRARAKAITALDPNRSN